MRAVVAQLVERHLAKVEVAGPSPVYRSISIWCHSQVVRRRSAKPLFSSSNLDGTSQLNPPVGRKAGRGFVLPADGSGRHPRAIAGPIRPSRWRLRGSDLHASPATAIPRGAVKPPRGDFHAQQSIRRRSGGCAPPMHRPYQQSPGEPRQPPGGFPMRSSLSTAGMAAARLCPPCIALISNPPGATSATRGIAYQPFRCIATALSVRA